MIGGSKIGKRNIYFQKKINLPPHNKVTISFTAFFIDDWEKKDRFFLFADDVKVVARKKAGGIVMKNGCGAIKVNKEKYKDVSVTFDHTRNTLKLRFKSNLD